MATKHTPPGPWLTMFNVDGDYYGPRIDTEWEGVEQRQQEAAQATGGNVQLVTIPLAQILAIPYMLQTLVGITETADMLWDRIDADLRCRGGTNENRGAAQAIGTMARAAIAKATKP